MPALSISQLPAAAALTGPELLPAVQGGATVRASVADLRAGLAATAHAHAPGDVTGLPAALAATRGFGRRTLWIPAAAMTASPLDGAVPGSFETVDHGVVLRFLGFDRDIEQTAQALLALPKAWDGGDLAVQPLWTASGGTGDVLWAIDALGLEDGEALDAIGGVAVMVADTLTTADALHVADESAPLVVDGAPTPSGLVLLTIARAASDTADTLDADARLLGLRVFYCVDAASDD